MTENIGKLLREGATFGQRVKAGKFALKAARHLDTRAAGPAYNAHLLAQKTAQMANNNPKTAGAALAGALASGLLGGLAAKAFRKKKQQTGSGLLGGIASQIGPARMLRAYHGFMRGKQKLDNAGWKTRFAAENALKHLRKNPRLASAAGTLLAASGTIPLLAHTMKKKKQQGGARRKTRGRITKRRRQRGAGILRKIPVLGDFINMII